MKQIDFTGWTDKEIEEFLIMLDEEELNAIMDDESMWTDATIEDFR